MASLKLKDGTKVPSVTTIIGNLAKPALYRWNNKQGLAGIDTSKSVMFETKTGTLVHSLVESYLEKLDEYYDESVYNQAHVEKAEHAVRIFKEWAKNHTFSDIQTELTLISEHYKYGGTIDIYCKMDDKWTLIDIKTSGVVYKDQLLQVAAYKNLLIENGYEVEQCLVVSIDKYEDIPAEVKELTSEEWFDFFCLFLALCDVQKYKERLNWS